MTRRSVTLGLAVSVVVVMVAAAIGWLAVSSSTVTDGEDVLGSWTVVEVDGSTPPADALPGIEILQDDGAGYVTRWSDGTNRIDVRWHLDDGTYLVDQSVTTDVGGPSRPSGFGVAAAVELHLDGDRLAFVGPDENDLAVYRRAGRG